MTLNVSTFRVGLVVFSGPVPSACDALRPGGNRICWKVLVRWAVFLFGVPFRCPCCFLFRSVVLLLFQLRFMILTFCLRRVWALPGFVLAG